MVMVATKVTTVGILPCERADWVREILAAVLAQSLRPELRLVVGEGEEGFVVDLDGTATRREGTLVRPLPDVVPSVPDPDQWYFSADTVVWRGASVRYGLVVAIQAGRAFVLAPLRELELPEGLVECVLAAVAAAQALGIDPQAIRSGLSAWRKGFRRLRLVGEFQGVRIWDDRACRSGEELRRSLAAFGRKVTLISGGEDFLGDVETDFVRLHANRVLLFPGTPTQVQRLWGAALQAASTDEAREALILGLERTSVGGSLLIAPGCPSGGPYLPSLEEAFPR
jgi:UDP-N-acetylmuramoylalanine-D-glutamate ligase